MTEYLCKLFLAFSFVRASNFIQEYTVILHFISQVKSKFIYQMHNYQIKHAEVIVGNEMYLITG